MNVNNYIKCEEISNFLKKDEANFKQLSKDFKALLKLEKSLSLGLTKFSNQLEKALQNESNK